LLLVSLDLDHNCLGFFDFALFSEFLGLLNVEIDLLLERIDSLISGFLLQSVHFRGINVEVLPSGATTREFNSCKTSLDFLINLCDHLFKESLELLLILSLIFITIGVVSEHIFEELIMTFLTSNKD
jgi:hypothetical protein